MINIFNNTKINFISKFKIFFFTSIFFIFLGFLFFVLKGPQLGIDFNGGTELIVHLGNYESNDAVFKNKISSHLNDNNIDSPIIKSYGNQKIQLLFDSSDINKNVINEIIHDFGDKSMNVLSYNKVGSTISSELKSSAFQALFIAILLIGFYIIIRFDWYSSLGSIVAIIHDILIVISFLMFFSYQFDINIIAAFLIIIGYSLNDTIVVFDRIRENLEEYSKMELYEIINSSLNETLSRTTITSLTTLFVLVSLFLFGGSSLLGLSFALIIGVISGTYSSIFIATPIMMFLRNKYYKEENIKEEEWQ
ncbi:protein translocase subunit SecF [bacterium]|nr:protein translocase subunit SecF [bacterium]